MLEHADTEVGGRLRRVALAVSTSVFVFKRKAAYEIADGIVLLAVSETNGMRAAAVSTRSGLPLDVVYPALHRLTDRGYALEEHRNHSLTVEGQRLVAEFDRVSAPLSITETKGTS